MTPSQTKVRDLIPEFSRELQTLVTKAGRPDLGEQIPDLPIVARCRCGESNCAHFYTAPPPAGAYPPGHTCLPLASAAGLLTLDLIGDRIVAVEILDRPDLKLTLDRHMPVGTVAT